MGRKWAIIVAVALGLLAVVLTNIYFQRRETQLRLVEKEVEQAAVLVAAENISKGSVVDYGMLAFKNMPIEFIQPGALHSRESAVGKTAVATIMAGEQVLETKLTTPKKGLTLAGKTPPGKRAFAISAEAASAVGGMLRPGDHVDVLASFSDPPVILTLFQDVLILAVGQEMIAEEKGGLDLKAADARGETITLALSPQEVQIINVAMEHGKLRLTLRPQMETGQALPVVDLTNLPPAMDLNTLLQLYIRPPKPGPSVEVIRGLKKEITPLPYKE